MTSAGDWQVSSRSHHSRSHSTLHGLHKVVTRSSQLHRSHRVVAVAVTSQLHHSHNCEQRFNDTASISVWRGEGMHSIECSLVTRTSPTASPGYTSNQRATCIYSDLRTTSSSFIAALNARSVGRSGQWLPCRSVECRRTNATSAAALYSRRN